MKRFWRYWGGHVLGAVTVAAMLATFYFTSRAFRADEPSIFFIALTAIAALLTVALMAMAAFIWNTGDQRRMMRYLESPPTASTHRHTPV